MTSSLNVSRLVCFLLMAIASVSGPAMASDSATMKMPVDGACEGAYVLLEGVCVSQSALQADPVTLLEKINAFKKNGGESSGASGPTSNLSDDNPTCARYKKMINDYLSQGVMTYNPETGKMEKMRGEATEEAIREAREYIDTFCND
ncbi:hypothetical protein [Desulfoluna spongiiphila]|uniref:Uncharacterized protein n=1 Tax=Desulfoluna spongiiphila TaxID=419481 RepID=A0A1G5E0A6_9BACT|nr:hypothetical protein [Desulfoluna spongiiphila]SCY20422.1 hypothetical protein SAMN05216233_10597 [Desulfoluna spongiiphila]VVS91522.1 hypothetical protein DBB_10900 [Desulfoluna spongiiphila]